jgi:hypothetical protein
MSDGNRAAQPLRSLLVCADDFGLTPGIDAAIAELVRAGRVCAFTCLTNGPAWAADAPQVALLRSQARAGLHVNLTEGRPLSPALAELWPQLPGLARLIRLAHLGRLPMKAVHAELGAQWQAFVDATGELPYFIDGHQHVHHLPGVRGMVIERVQRAWPRPLVRSTANLPGPGSGLKRWLIARSGGQALERALQVCRLPHNRVLLGAYDFGKRDYRRLMQRWLAQVPATGALLFCHPGRPSADDAPDPIAAARQRELAYLAGDEFPQDLADAGVRLDPVWRDA